MSDKMFENAARKKYRYPFNGMISTEDLWDLSLKNLDTIYKVLKSEIKDDSDSLLDEIGSENKEVLAKIDIIKHIVSIKKDEMVFAKEASERQNKKQRILEILERKEVESLENMSEDDLKKLLNNM